METKRLFDDMPYVTMAEGKVIRCIKTDYRGVGCYAVELDKTIFFPEEGGQSPDKGQIDGIDVLDVQVKNRCIIHYLESPVDEGSIVKLSLDWKHRFSNMQNHSGEHIFSGTVHRLFGYENVGFHLSDNSATMDFNGVISDEDLRKVENIVNEAIAKNVEITAEYVDSDALKQIEYRSKKELDGPVRIVTIEDYDVCACCAPHVKRTGEIGIFKIVHTMNYKGGVRVSYLCGFRALEYYRDSLYLIDELTDFMSTGRENLVENVKKLKSDNMTLSSELLKAKQEILKRELEKIPAEQENVYIFQPKTDNLVMKNTVNTLLEKHIGVVAFFAGSDAEGYNYMIASKSKDTRELQNLLREKLAAKGGGKPEMICGSVLATENDIKQYMI